MAPRGGATLATSDPIGIIAAGPFGNEGSNINTIGAANRCQYNRIRQGYGPISKIGIFVGVSSGNISVAVYRNTGVGVAAAPTGAPVATSGAVACPTGSAYAEVALGSTVYVGVGDWLAVSADNNTATFGGTGTNNAATMAGLHCYQTTAHPAPTVGSVSFGGRAYVLLGIA